MYDEPASCAAVAHNVVNAIARSPYTRKLDAHFRVLETIPFPSVCVISLDDFVHSLF